ncbi:MAG: pro-sigmaK processing inhibitor BofA family protein [Peptococcaceae bacterium]|jgi:inhibitor of the pro-sigma K processing machinery|nr:pro-sigmaK processing inhibitor BofA family protein [Peptococcaceae bacterium]
MTLILLGISLILMAVLLVTYIRAPKGLIRMGLHVILGLAGLWLLNLVLSVADISIPINTFSVLFVGLLGLPGLGVLIVLRILGV